MTHRKFLILVNPAARSGRAEKQLRVALNGFGGEAAAIVRVRSVDEAMAAITDTRYEDTVPVAAGGDGTVNMVVRAVMARPPRARTIGVLPLGTGNLFAHLIGAGSLDHGLRILQHGTARPFDIFRTTHPQLPLAVMSISVGIESQFLQTFAAWRRRGRALAFAAAGVRCIRSRSTSADLTLDEDTILSDGEIYNCGLYNAPCYAFGHMMFPDAVVSDGAGDAVIHTSARSYWRAFFRGMRLSSPGKREAPICRRWQRARMGSVASIQADGETIAGGSFDVWVDRRVFRTLIDPTSQWFRKTQAH